MVTFYIIGNGFDLFHGLKTKYSDFHEYIKNKHPDRLAVIESAFELNTDADWSNLELTLSRTSIRNIQTEYERTRVILDGITNHDEYEIKCNELAESIQKPYSSIIHSLEEWMDQIDSQFNAIRSNAVTISNEDFCLSFNYTYTVEKLYMSPDKPLEHICHIHGLYDCGIILGHNILPGLDLKIENPIRFEGDGLDAIIHIEDDPMVDWPDNRIHMALNYINRALFKNSTEHIKRNMNFFNNIEKSDIIVIYGWSLGECDWIYMDEVLKHLKKQPITCVIYSIADKTNYERYFKEKRPGDYCRLRFVLWNELKDN